MTSAPSGEQLIDEGEAGVAAAPAATVEELLAELADLSVPEHAEAAHAELREVKHLIAEAHQRGLIDSTVRHLGTRDVAEAFVGSVIFVSPLLVEDGIFDIADHLLRFSVGPLPFLLLVNSLFVVTMTYALVEWTGRDRDETVFLLGVFPVRVLMILLVSFVVATLLMTLWGRVGGWASPVEAIARINVVWTVGSLGAALGDILSQQEPVDRLAEQADGPPNDDSPVPEADGEPGTDGAGPTTGDLTDGALIDELNEQFEELASTVGTRAEREEVERLRREAVQAALDDVFGDRIQKYTSRDIAEAFVGSIFFSIPFLVEDGVFDVATYFLTFRLGQFPILFLANAGFVVVMILALVYWAGPQDVRVFRPVLGLVPRRLIGIAVVSFLTTAALMTLWGRVGNWDEPIVALARISVVWTVASFGAALGDILPGESSGPDINDDWAAIGEADGESTEASVDPKP